jgi:tricorn protease-like protein
MKQKCVLLTICILINSLSPLSISSNLNAQTGMPITTISLINIDNNFNSIKGSLKALTERKDYDNQPHFVSNNRLYFTRHLQGQTDIWQIDLNTNKKSAVTKTTESEYSPTLMPDGKHFSVIRVETDNTQRLWSFDLKGEQAKVLLDDIKPVGYHLWLTAQDLVLFILGKPSMTLQLANLTTGKAVVLDKDIGRSLHKIKAENAFSYSVHREDQNEIRIYDIKTNTSRRVAGTLEGSEDYVWLADGSVLMAQGNKIFRFQDNKWTFWSELKSLGDISRLALSPDGTKLALVHGPASK